MHYVYVLKSLKDKKLYVGHTSDLKKRVQRHNHGLNIATKTRRPLKLLFYEAFINKSDAIRDELFFKTGYGREVLKEKTKSSLQMDEVASSATRR
ncbi:GIY-YIG nuclease family protein [Planctomycetota bacterium]